MGACVERCISSSGRILYSKEGCESVVGMVQYIMLQRHPVKRKSMESRGRINHQCSNCPWIYNKSDFKMEMRIKRELLPVMKVATLINPDRTWNSKILNEVVVPQDVLNIMQMLIPPVGKPDCLIWPYTDDERVTVKSVYHRLREVHEGRPVDLGRYGNRATSIWHTIWKADITPHIKSFVWRLLSNLLGSIH